RWPRDWSSDVCSSDLSTRQPPSPAAADLPPPPPAQALRLASFGEPEAAARLVTLYVQAFDLGGGNALPYKNLDYRRLTGWLSARSEERRVGKQSRSRT